MSAEPGLPLIPTTVIPVEFQRSTGVLSRLLGIILFVVDLIKRTSRIVAMIEITNKVTRIPLETKPSR